MVFDNFLDELLQKRIKIDEFLDGQTLEKLIENNKLYRGITLKNESMTLIDSLKKDEFDIDTVFELEQFSRQKDFYKMSNDLYKQRLNNLISMKKKEMGIEEPVPKNPF